MKAWLLVLALAASGSLAGAGEGDELLRVGRLAVQQGDYAGAIRLLEQAVVRAPGETEVHHWLGNAYAWAAATAELCDKPALGRKCLAAYRRAVELDPDNLPARFSLMNFYRHVPGILGGGMGRARGEAAEIARRDPVQGLRAQAVLHAHEKDYAAAFTALDEALRMRPDDYACLALFGRLALEAGQRPADGVAALQRCLGLVPSATDDSHDTVEQHLAQLRVRKTAAQTVARTP